MSKTKGKKAIRNTLKEVRVPVPKEHFPGFNSETMRVMTVGQLAVLLWHLYRCANDPEAGYLDANTDLTTLLTRKLNKTIKLSKRDLESLLWAGNMADKLGFWWSPDNKTFSQFIQPLLFKNELFDTTWNLLLDTRRYKRLRSETRYIKKQVIKMTDKQKDKE